MKKIFYISVDDLGTGMDAISLVSAPAVEKDFICMSKEEQKTFMNFDDSKHIISGVVALADTPIYRYSPSQGEYWVVFTKDTILKMVEKYSQSGLFNSVNFEHNNENFTDSVIMIESYLVDRERGIVPNEFSDVPEGSWICSFKVTDDALWNRIVNTDEFNGFSLQGMFRLKESFEKQSEPESFDEWLEKQING